MLLKSNKTIYISVSFAQQPKARNILLLFTMCMQSNLTTIYDC